jgi:hypothetical protein
MDGLKSCILLEHGAIVVGFLCDRGNRHLHSHYTEKRLSYTIDKYWWGVWLTLYTNLGGAPGLPDTPRVALILETRI